MFDKLRVVFPNILLTFFLVGCSLAVVPGDYEERPVYQDPQVPSGFSANVDYSDDSVVLSWDTVEGAGYYTVYYMTQEDLLQNLDPQVDIVSSNTVEYALVSTGSTTSRRGLDKDKVYMFSVSSTSSLSGLESGRTPYEFVSTLSDFEFISPKSEYLSYSISVDGAVYLGQSLVKPDFTIEFFSDQDLMKPALTLAGDEIPIRKVAFANGASSWTFPEDQVRLLSNTTYFYKVVMLVDGVEVSSQVGSFMTNPSYTAPPVYDANAISNLAGEIRISFTAPVINPGMEASVERCFRLVRVSDGVEKVVLEEMNCDVLDMSINDNGTATYVFHDTDVDSGAEYSYKIISYYHFLDEDEYVEGDSVRLEGFHHPLSSPAVSAATLTPVDDAKTQYLLDMTFYLPFGIHADSTFELAYIDNASSSQDSTAIKIDDVTPVGNNVYELKARLSISEEDAEYTHYFVFSLRHAIGEQKSESGLSESLQTQPTKENVAVFFTDFAASENKGGGVYLTWTYADSEGFISDNVVYKLYRSLTAVLDNADLIAEIDDPVSGSHIDESAEPGTKYVYTLRAEYLDEDSTFNGVYTMASDNGNRLGEISHLTATQGRYLDRSEIRWNGVDGAAGYNVYVDEKTEPYARVVNSEYDGMFGVDYSETADAGIVHMFKVVPYDDEGTEGIAADTVYGNLLGPNGLNPNATVNEHGDRIVLSWTDIPGAMQYRISIYYDDVRLTQQTVTSGIESFVFSTQDPSLSSVPEYPLSQAYGFEIQPMYESEISDPSGMVYGSWAQPPKDIVASNGEYNNIVRVEWEPVEGASYYRIYRRHVGENVWTDTNVTSASTSAYDILPEDSASVAYEYSVASVFGSNIVGEPQNWFPGETKSNIGQPLYAPQNVRIIQTEYSSDYFGDIDSDTFRIQFDENEFATSYIIDCKEYDQSYEFFFNDDGTLSSCIPNQEGGVTGKIENGVVYITVKRPVLDLDQFFSFSLYCQNDSESSAGHPLDVTSYPTEVVLMPERIYHEEAVRFLNPVLSSILHTIDDAWQGDWWPYSGWYKDQGTLMYYGEPDGIVYAESCPTAFTETSPQKPAVVRVNGYLSTRDSLSISVANFGILPEQVFASAGANSVQTLTSDASGNNELIVEFYNLHTKARIEFDNVDVVNNSGEYIVWIDFDNDGLFEESERDTVTYADAYTEPF